MNDYLKIKQLLGLCLRAGQLVSGESLVLEAIRKQKAKLVLVTEDASAATKKKFFDKTTYYQVPIITAMTSEDYFEAIGKPRKIVAITNPGFAKKLQQLFEEKGD